MNILARFILPLAALAFSACDGGHEAPATLSPEAAAEYMQVRERLEIVVQDALDQLDEEKPFFGEECERSAYMRRLAQEILDMLDAYEQSGDVKLTTPTVHHTVLHFAVQNRMEKLVDELLQQGADPNAVCDVSYMGFKEMDAPLAWIATPNIVDDELTSKPYAETAIRLIDKLLAAGARVDGDAGGHALIFCSLRDEGEDVYLHLLERGANPRLGYMRHRKSGDEDEDYFSTAMDFFFHNNWARALEKLLDTGHLPLEWRNRDMQTPLFILVEEQIRELRSEESRDEDESPAEFAEEVNKEAKERLELIRILLERGANPNAPMGGGWTPLTYAACLPPREVAFAPAWKELIDLLLKHGGNTDVTVPAHYDEPARSVRDWLKLQGF